MQPCLYCVEDDVNIRELIGYVLRSQDFEVQAFPDGDSFLAALEDKVPDAILLDIMLPGKDGMTLLKYIRSQPNYENIPVLLITAKTAEVDAVQGLDAGADDYIKKPFSVVELVSRIRAVLRRCTAHPESDEKKMESGNVVIDKKRRTVTVGKHNISLTFKEFELLVYLVSNEDIVLTREQMMNTVWGFSYEGESRTVDMHIKTLRKKLKDAQEHIVTVRGIGYVWKEKV